jgi:hypothetical protein
VGADGGMTLEISWLKVGCCSLQNKRNWACPISVQYFAYTYSNMRTCRLDITETPKNWCPGNCLVAFCASFSYYYLTSVHGDVLYLGTGDDMCHNSSPKEFAR